MIKVSVSVEGNSQIHFKFNPGDTGHVDVIRMAITEDDTKALLDAVMMQIRGMVSE
jgi:hypothetical protein